MKKYEIINALAGKTKLELVQEIVQYGLDHELEHSEVQRAVDAVVREDLPDYERNHVIFRALFKGF